MDDGLVDRKTASLTPPTLTQDGPYINIQLY
jgi:hypothetical protein